MKDGDHLAVWAFILLSAVYEPEDVDFEGKRLTLKPGQFTTGRKQISEALKIDEHKIDRILKRFETERQIEQQMSSKCRLITVLKWGEYQKVEQQNGHQMSTNKEIKNTERKKNTEPIAPDVALGKEKKQREKQPHYELIEFFFQQKGWEMNPALARRWFRASREVLQACEEDLSLAKEKLLKVKVWADVKVLDWTLETILKRWQQLDEVTATAPKKPYIEGCPAYRKGDDWYVINKDGSHVKWIGSLREIKYA